jgi:hypothetical protein
MNKKIMALVITVLFTAGTLAQKQGKPWGDWNKKDAEKMLADSPWSQTQTETDTSEMVYRPTNPGDTHAQETGSINQATSVKFHIRLFSARPVRQAYVRLLELNQGQPDEAAAEKRRAWANLAASDSIIVTVACESDDRRYLGRATQAFNSAVTSILKNTAYLERNDGKRVFLGEYKPPSKDLFGARFIFPRMVDGQPFITADSGSLRFHAEYESKTGLDTANNAPGQVSRRATNATTATQTASPFKFKLDMKFKVAELMYNGEVEY